MRLNSTLNSNSTKDTASSGVISNYCLSKSRKLCHSSSPYAPKLSENCVPSLQAGTIRKTSLWHCRGCESRCAHACLFNHCNLTCMVSPNDGRSIYKFYIQAFSPLSGLFLSHLLSCHLYSWQDVQSWQFIACQHPKRTPLLKYEESSIFDSEVNDSIFKLISEWRRFTWCFSKVHLLGIMKSEYCMIHEPLSGEKELRNHLFQSLGSEASDMGYLWNPMLLHLADRPRQAPEYNHQFQGHGTSVLGWVTALPFPIPIPVIALLAGIGKNLAYLAPVSSSQIEGFLSNKWHICWLFNIKCTFVLLLQEDNTCEGNTILFPQPSTVIFLSIWGKAHIN